MNGQTISSSLVKQSNPEEHNFFISEINKAIKDVQHLAASTSCRLRISNDDWQLQRLTERLDHLFLYGLKSYLKGYFEAFREFTHHSIVDEISHLQNIHTNIGKSRAWLLHALRDHLLGSYLQCTVAKSKHLSKFYDRRSLFFDEPRLELLITLASGLENIEFELNLDIDHLDLYCYGGNLMNFKLDDESQSLIPTNISSNVEDHVFLRLKAPSTSSVINSAPRESRSEDGNISRECEHVVVQHMPRKKKKGHKNKETDNTSLSSDSSNVFLPDIPTCASMNAVDGYVDPGCDRHVDHNDHVERQTEKRQTEKHHTEKRQTEKRQTPANDVEISFAVNDIFKGVKPSKKSAESLLFDELFEKIVFGKIVPSVANKDPNPASEDENEMKSHASAAENVEFVETIECFNTPGDGERVCDDEQLDSTNQQRIALSEDPEIEQRIALSEDPEIEQRIALSEDPEIERISETGLVDETRQQCCVFDEVPFVENVCNEVNTTECLEVTRISKENQGNEDDTDSIENLVEDDVQESNVAKLDLPQNNLEETSEFKVSNNLKVLLFLDIFKNEDEIFVKAFETFQNFMEGNPIPLLTVVTSHAIYFIISCHGKLKLHGCISHKDLSFLSIGLDEQSLDFVEKSKRRYSLCTCNPQLTRTLVDEISRTINEHFIAGRLLILGEAINQRISIKRWISSINPKLKATSAIIRGFFLISYSTCIREGTRINKVENKSILKKGHLHVLTLAQHMHGISVMWRKGWFVLRNDSLHEFTDDSGTMEVSSFRLSEWQDCKKCSKSSSGRRHCFSLVPSSLQGMSNQVNKLKSKSSISQFFQTSPISSGSRCKRALPSLTFSARTTEDAKEWIDSLKSVIRNSWRNDHTKKISHGCCILIGNDVHLCSMNSVTCEISNHVSFPLNDLHCLTYACGRLIKLSFSQVVSQVSQGKKKEENKQCCMSDTDFEVVEFKDVMDDDSVDGRCSSAVEMSPVKSLKESDGFSSKLSLFFQSTDDMRRFCSEIKSMFLNVTGKELEVTRDDNDDDDNAIEEIARNCCDWNSLDGVMTSIS